MVDVKGLMKSRMNNKEEVNQEKVTALINWYKAGLKLAWVGSKTYTEQVSINTQELRKEFKERADKVNLNWDEYCEVCDKLDFQF